MLQFDASLIGWSSSGYSISSYHIILNSTVRFTSTEMLKVQVPWSIWSLNQDKNQVMTSRTALQHHVGNVYIFTWLQSLKPGAGRSLGAGTDSSLRHETCSPLNWDSAAVWKLFQSRHFLLVWLELQVRARDQCMQRPEPVGTIHVAWSSPGASELLFCTSSTGFLQNTVFSPQQQQQLQPVGTSTSWCAVFSLLCLCVLIPACLTCLRQSELRWRFLVILCPFNAMK